MTAAGPPPRLGKKKPQRAADEQPREGAAGQAPKVNSQGPDRAAHPGRADRSLQQVTTAGHNEWREKGKDVSSRDEDVSEGCTDLTVSAKVAEAGST